MKIRNLHNWNLSTKEARKLQTELALLVKEIPLKKRPRTVSACDTSCNRFGKYVFAAVVVMDAKSLEPIEVQKDVFDFTYPYIPGLLSFREAPPLLELFSRLKSNPDLVFVDGQGIAHPRRLGLAAHLGLFLNIPVIGCAKTHLYGSYENPSPERGTYSELKDDKDGKTIGAVVRSKSKVNPLFISVGNKITLSDAIKEVLHFTGRYRIPEPIRLAHYYANEIRRQSDRY